MQTIQLGIQELDKKNEMQDSSESIITRQLASGFIA
jgi:hypothetical protein